MTQYVSITFHYVYIRYVYRHPDLNGPTCEQVPLNTNKQ